MYLSQLIRHYWYSYLSQLATTAVLYDTNYFNQMAMAGYSARICYFVPNVIYSNRL